jgi:hypothetical protein
VVGLEPEQGTVHFLSQVVYVSIAVGGPSRAAHQSEDIAQAGQGSELPLAASDGAGDVEGLLERFGGLFVSTMHLVHETEYFHRR